MTGLLLLAGTAGRNGWWVSIESVVMVGGLIANGMGFGNDLLVAVAVITASFLAYVRTQRPAWRA